MRGVGLLVDGGAEAAALGAALVEAEAEGAAVGADALSGGELAADELATIAVVGADAVIAVDG